MAERICEAGENLEIWRVHLDETREQELNARYMPPEMMDRLSDNIRKEGRLESLPFCVKRGEVFEVVSGHHRLRAARSAGIMETLLLVDTRDLDRSQIVAKQLAHNAIDGEDDKEILKRLFAEMKRVDDILESFVDPKSLDFEAAAQPVDLSNVKLEFPFKTMTLTFLPEQMEKFDDLFKAIPKDAQVVGVAHVALFDRFREALLALGKVEDIRSIGAMLAYMVEITEGYVAERTKEQEAA